jgi:hypothetical protein
MISVAFLLAALVLFILAAAGIASGRVNLLAAGLACWALSAMLTGWKF